MAKKKNLNPTSAPQIDAVALRERSGPRSLYSSDQSRMGAVYLWPQVNQDGTVELVERLVCTEARTLDVAGQERTNRAGTFEWRLRARVCRGEFDRVAEPVSFVATPTTEYDRFANITPFTPPDPVFVTAEYRLVDNATDLLVTVSSWLHDGTPVGNVPFSYRAMFRVTRSFID